VKNNTTRHKNVDRTEAIRLTLTFLQFLENKIISKQVYHLSSIDMKEIPDFDKFIERHSK
jgi:hypothetical protein